VTSTIEKSLAVFISLQRFDASTFGPGLIL